jgi:1-phosphofructokinase family hexose kinase
MNVPLLLAITPNPALDRTLVIPHLLPGSVHRAERVLLAAGGKGLNVARAAHTLGQPLRVCGPLGGHTGQLVAQLAAAEGFVAHWHWHQRGETRTCVLVVDPQGSDATALNEPGEPLTVEDWHAFGATVLEAAQDAALVTISGSLPPGVPPAEITTLLRRLAAAGHRVIIDTSGPALQAALKSAPYGLKVNSSELGAALGRSLDSLDDAAQALRELHTRGIALPLVTLGAVGALAASAEGIVHVMPPAINLVSSVGSGDSLLAGLACGLLRGEHLTDALRLGVACGTADALTVGGGLIDLAEVQRLRAATTLYWR